MPPLTDARTHWENSDVLPVELEGDYSHIWAVFYLAEVKLALGKRAEADTLFGQASELGRRQWGANDFRFVRLVRDIDLARAAASR